MNFSTWYHLKVNFKLTLTPILVRCPQSLVSRKQPVLPKKNRCTLTTTITVHIMCRDIIITICHLNFEGESTTNYIKVVFFCRIRFFFFVRSIGLLSRI